MTETRVNITTDEDPSSRLAVCEVFGPTFQGEGPNMGRRATFLRLAGCDLDCTWCDTPYSWDWNRYDKEEEVTMMRPRMLVDQILEVDQALDLLVISGGEPMLQQRKLRPVIERLASLRHDAENPRRPLNVQFESNGRHEYRLWTQGEDADPWLNANIDVVMSPKLPSSGVSADRAWRPEKIDQVRTQLSGQAHLKFVVQNQADILAMKLLLDMLEEDWGGAVWVMPETTDPAMLQPMLQDLAPIALANNWHLSTRMHVDIWGDVRGV